MSRYNFVVATDFRCQQCQQRKDNKFRTTEVSPDGKHYRVVCTDCAKGKSC